MLRYFKVLENQSSVRTELLAGVTTFLTMVYMAIVIPALLAQTGMDKGSVFVASCLVAIVGSLLMALLANYPVAVAPGLSLAVYVVYSVVLTKGFSWQAALGAVGISGVLFLILNVLNAREIVIRSIPHSMKMALPAGVGLFLGLIALHTVGLVEPSSTHLLQMGDMGSHSVLLCLFGFICIIALDRLRIPGAILLGILLTTFFGTALGYQTLHGVFSLPPSLFPTLFQWDFTAIKTLDYWAVAFTLFYVSFFDCTGTLMGVTQDTHLIDRSGRMKNMRRALSADALSTVFASCVGTSPAGTYLESAAGIRAGGRTGLTAVTVAFLFLVTLFFSPFISAIPDFATAPAILYVACLMTQSLSRIAWDELTEFVPSLLTVILMPLTFSIADAIAVGLVVYVLIQFVCGRWSLLNPVLLFLGALSAVYLMV